MSNIRINEWTAMASGSNCAYWPARFWQVGVAGGQQIQLEHDEFPSVCDSRSNLMPV